MFNYHEYRKDVQIQISIDIRGCDMNMSAVSIDIRRCNMNMRGDLGKINHR